MSNLSTLQPGRKVAADPPLSGPARAYLTAFDAWRADPSAETLSARRNALNAVEGGAVGAVIYNDPPRCGDVIECTPDGLLTVRDRACRSHVVLLNVRYVRGAFGRMSRFTEIDATERW